MLAKAISILSLVVLAACAQAPKIDDSVSTDDAIRVAASNLMLTGGRTVDAHFQAIDEAAKEAQFQHAKYLLLPELTSLDLFDVNPESKAIPDELAKLAAGAISYEGRLREIARNRKLSIIGASTVFKRGKSWINRSFYIDAQGNSRHQDKVYPTPWEVKYGFTGGKGIRVFRTDDFSFVILVCHDAEFPNLSSKLSKEHPEVIFVPSQTDSQAGLERVRRTSQARAVEHMAYVVMTGASGVKGAPWHSYIGQNYLFSPQNQYFKPREQDEAGSSGVTIYDLNLSVLREARKDQNQVYPAREIH